MSRRNTHFCKGSYYHLYNRSILQLPICYGEKDHFRLLRRLFYLSDELNVTIIAWCIMPNHFHLLVRQDGEESAGKLPARLFNSYNKYFNGKYGRKGMIFESAFKAKPVQSKTYLMHLCRYIHANPVIAGLINSPGNWLYSNYGDFGDPKGTVDDALPDVLRDSKKYAAWVAEYIKEAGSDPRDPYDMLKSIEEAELDRQLEENARARDREAAAVDPGDEIHPGDTSSDSIDAQSDSDERDLSEKDSPHLKEAPMAADAALHPDDVAAISAVEGHSRVTGIANPWVTPDGVNPESTVQEECADTNTASPKGACRKPLSRCIIDEPRFQMALGSYPEDLITKGRIDRESLGAASDNYCNTPPRDQQTTSKTGQTASGETIEAKSECMEGSASKAGVTIEEADDICRQKETQQEPDKSEADDMNKGNAGPSEDIAPDNSEGHSGIEDAAQPHAEAGAESDKIPEYIPPGFTETEKLLAGLIHLVLGNEGAVLSENEKGEVYRETWVDVLEDANRGGSS